MRAAYADAYMRQRVLVCTCAYAHTHVCAHTRIRTYVYTRMRICTYVHIRAYARMRQRVLVCSCAYARMCPHTTRTHLRMRVFEMEGKKNSTSDQRGDVSHCKTDIARFHEGRDLSTVDSQNAISCAPAARCSSEKKKTPSAGCKYEDTYVQ